MMNAAAKARVMVNNEKNNLSMAAILPLIVRSDQTLRAFHLQSKFKSEVTVGIKKVDLSTFVDQKGSSVRDVNEAGQPV